MFYRLTLFLSMYFCWRVNGLTYKVYELNKCFPIKDSFLTHTVGGTISDCVDQCERRPSCQLLEYSARVKLCNLFGLDNITLTNGHCTIIKRTDILPDSPCGENCVDGQVCNTQNNCVKQECDPLGLTNVTYYGNTNTFGSRKQYVCEYDNLKVKILHDVTCLQNGTWDHIPACEVLWNVALDKAVTMSSNYLDGSAPEKLVNGNIYGIWPECASTNFEPMPWMVVDLVVPYEMYAFHIYNRIDCCPERLHNLKITVGETFDTLKFCSGYKGLLDPVVHKFILKIPCVGRYVHLQKMSIEPEKLTIAELEVFGVRKKK